MANETTIHGDTPDAITKRIDTAIARERERCAQIAEIDCRSELAIGWNYQPEYYKHGKRIAAAIRQPI